MKIVKKIACLFLMSCILPNSNASAFFGDTLVKDQENSFDNSIDSQTTKDLLLAVFEGDIDKVTLLIEHGADINAPNTKGYTLLDLAALNNNKELVNLLIHKGASVSAFSNVLVDAIISKRQDLAELLASQGIGTRYSDSKGNTSLMYAVRNKNAKLVDILLNDGVNVNAKNKSNKTALMYASLLSNSQAKTSIIKNLVSHGANINELNHRGRSTLIYAIEYVDYETVEFLLVNGAEINIKGENGKNTIDEMLKYSDDTKMKKIIEDYKETISFE